MLNKFMALLLFVSLAGLTACTSANQPTGRSNVRQAPDDAAMNQQPYDAHQPMDAPAGSTQQGGRTGGTGSTGGNAAGNTGTGSPAGAGTGGNTGGTP